VRERDRRAFEALYDRFQKVVYGVAIRMLGERSAAEDVVQSVFLTVWSRPDAFREGNLGAWLTRIARNRCLDILRSRSAHAEEELPVEILDAGSLDDTVFARLDGNRVRAALAALPQEQRTLVEMGFFDGITHTEIAARTGIPLGTIKSRIRAGLRQLRGQLEGLVMQ
jgi:RNA polymerase sigma-70 factor (ECF subfamily)